VILWYWGALTKVCVFLTLYFNALDLTHYIIKINSHFIMKSWNRSVERIFTDLVIYSNCLRVLFNFDGSYDFFVFIININASLKKIFYGDLTDEMYSFVIRLDHPFQNVFRLSVCAMLHLRAWPKVHHTLMTGTRCSW